MDAGFPKKTMLKQKLERDVDSTKTHPALVAVVIHHPVIAVTQRAAVIQVAMAGRIAGSARRTGSAATFLHLMSRRYFWR
jgi:hypothetical protein